MNGRAGWLLAGLALILALLSVARGDPTRGERVSPLVSYAENRMQTLPKCRPSGSPFIAWPTSAKAYT